MARNNPTAAILTIGDEILSGQTLNTNAQDIAVALTKHGVDVLEMLTVPDEEARIIAAVRCLSKQYTYVISTGGIGPTHDDITSPSMAKAFDREYVINHTTLAEMEKHYGTQGVNEARMRMAMMPEGVTLIPASPEKAPNGFQVENVFVLAGVPRIMRAMLAHVLGMIEGGKPLCEAQITLIIKEGDLAAHLNQIIAQFPNVSLGSYPRFADGCSEVTVVVKGENQAEIDVVLAKLMKIRDVYTT